MESIAIRHFFSSGTSFGPRHSLQLRRRSVDRVGTDKQITAPDDAPCNEW
jgi:hypothetical protein